MFRRFEIIPIIGGAVALLVFSGLWGGLSWIIGFRISLGLGMFIGVMSALLAGLLAGLLAEEEGWLQGTGAGLVGAAIPVFIRLINGYLWWGWHLLLLSILLSAGLAAVGGVLGGFIKSRFNFMR